MRIYPLVYEHYLNDQDFIQKYIFLGSHCPTLTHLVQSAHIGSDKRLILDSCENFGLHYAKTLKIWREKFLENYYKLDRIKFDEKFKRMWVYYMTYCEAGFSYHCLNLIQVAFTTTGNELLCLD